MRRRISIRGCVRPSARRSVCPVLFSKVKSTHTRLILYRVSGLVVFITIQLKLTFSSPSLLKQFVRFIRDIEEQSTHLVREEMDAIRILLKSYDFNYEQVS